MVMAQTLVQVGDVQSAGNGYLMAQPTSAHTILNHSHRLIESKHRLNSAGSAHAVSVSIRHTKKNVITAIEKFNIKNGMLKLPIVKERTNERHAHC